MAFLATQSRNIFLLTIGVVLLVILFWNVDKASLQNAMSMISIRDLFISMSLILLSVFAKVQRWLALLTTFQRDISKLDILSCNCIGFLAAQVFPAKAGEIVRSFVLSQKTDLKTLTIFGTVIVERGLDLAVILAISTSAWIALDSSDSRVDTIHAVAFAALCVLCLAIATVRYLHKHRYLFRFFGESRGKIRTAIIEGFESVVRGLGVVKNRSQVFVAMLWTLVIWLLIAAAVAPLLYSFEIAEDVPVLAIFTLLLFLTAGLALPAAPASIGVFEFAVYLALSVFVITGNDGDSGNAEIAVFAIVLHIIFIVPEIILGTYFVIKEGTSFADLKKMRVDK